MKTAKEELQEIRLAWEFERGYIIMPDEVFRAFCEQLCKEQREKCKQAFINERCEFQEQKAIENASMPDIE